MENFINNGDGFQRFCDANLTALIKHALCKIKHVGGNQMRLFGKEISKAITKRTKLYNNFFQHKTRVKIESFMQNKETFVFLF